MEKSSGQGSEVYLVVAFCAVADRTFATHNFYDRTVWLYQMADKILVEANLLPSIRGV
jgi:hypothetical protein